MNDRFLRRCPHESGRIVRNDRRSESVLKTETGNAERMKTAMNVHRTTGRWRLGLLLALITAMAWAVLPIALKILVDVLDAVTITWTRFLISSLMLFPLVYRKNRFLPLKKLRGHHIALLLLAAVGICGNYSIYVLGLQFLTPSTAQIVIQSSLVFLLMGSIFVFKESLNHGQWIGVGVFIMGLFLFFNDRLVELFTHQSKTTLGIALVLVAAVLWSLFAMAQKQLLKNLSSDTIMLMIYIGAVIVFLPFTKPAHLLKLDTAHLVVLGFCGLNTLIAYGCFAESMAHLEASRVSAVLAIIPLFTVAAMKLGVVLLPDWIASEEINTLSLFGAILVVGGSLLCTLGK